METVKMTFASALKRSVATLVAGAVSSPIASIAFDMAWWKAASVAGLTAVVNLAGRSVQAWLAKHPET